MMEDDGVRALARAVIVDAVQLALRARCMWSARWLLSEDSTVWFWLAGRRRSDVTQEALAKLNEIAQWDIVALEDERIAS